MTPGPAPRRLFLLVLGAVLLMQTAWILAVPAFRGIDEFDHVYKAEAVAHGQLRTDGAPQNGRGELLTVPADVVAAASARCAAYAYTGPDNCHAVEERGGGLVTVASGAATYNPTYYAVVGLMARPFEGSASVFAMRAFTAVLAALLLAWAAVATSGWARNGWPLGAMLVTVTPVLVYSTSVASPNGVGYAAACLLWAAGLGLVEDPRRPRLVALTVAALVMMATHTTGAMWLAFVVVVLALLQPLRRWRSLVATFPRGFTVAAATVAVGGLACAAWILSAGTNAVEPPAEDAETLPFARLASSQLAWVFQTIGAFPLRDDSAPTLVYALWAVPFAVLLVAGIRQGSTRLRVAGAVLLLIWVAVPVIATYHSYAELGIAWQGRYALPLAVGFPALAGLALHRSPHAGPTRLICATAVGVCALAQAISVVWVAWTERNTGLSATFAAEVSGGIVLIAVLALLGGLVPLLLVRRATTDHSQPVHVAATAANDGGGKVSVQR